MFLSAMAVGAAFHRAADRRIIERSWGGRGMRPLLGVLICVLTLCLAIGAEMLTPQAFTEEFARALTRALPSSSVSVAGDLKLTMKEDD